MILKNLLAYANNPIKLTFKQMLDHTITIIFNNKYRKLDIVQMRNKFINILGNNKHVLEIAMYTPDLFIVIQLITIFKCGGRPINFMVLQKNCFSMM
jgi:hypothetical protein